jgi:hypothetical protein
MVEDAGLVVVQNSVSSLLALVIKMVIVVAIGVASYYYFEKGQTEDITGSMFSAIVLLCMCLGYLIADSFTDTFEMTADALLICFLEDGKHNVRCSHLLSFALICSAHIRVGGHYRGICVWEDTIGGYACGRTLSEDMRVGGHYRRICLLSQRSQHTCVNQ